MEGKQQQIFAANKLATTVGAISFTDEEIVVQSDIDLIGSEVDTLVVENDQQKYEEFLFSGSGDLDETRRYRRMYSDIRAAGKKVSTEKRGFLETAALGLMLGQEILAEGELPTAEEDLETGLTEPNSEIGIGE